MTRYDHRATLGAALAATFPAVARVASLTAVALVAGCAADRPEGPPRPNVLLVVVDTLRADALGCYGNTRGTSPFLDAFAADAVLFEDAQAPSPHTAPSHASLFTSTDPATHEIWNEVFRGDEMLYPRLPRKAVTLAEVLREAGYETAAIADGGWVSAERGFDQGFDRFESDNRGVVDRVDRALAWLDDRDDDEPFFLFLHTYEVHAPYLPTPELEERFAGDYRGPLRSRVAEAIEFAASHRVEHQFDLQAQFFDDAFRSPTPEEIEYLHGLYLAEVVTVDAELARLFDELRRRGLYDDTVIVITSDHGEEFGEHGRMQHGQLYQELLHVPMLVRTPDGPRGIRVAEPVTLTDLMPSLLVEVGVAVPDSAAGSAFDLGGEARFAPDRLRVAECRWKDYRQLTARRGDWKVYFKGDGDDLVPALFDLGVDPGEQAALPMDPVSTPIVDRARADLRAWLQAAARHGERHGLEVEEVGLDAYGDRLDELRGLGYIGP